MGSTAIGTNIAPHKADVLMTAKFPPELIEALRSASHIAVLTGAGISAESGVPTFRQAQTGLWAQYDPQELATPQAFQTRAWYGSGTPGGAPWWPKCSPIPVTLPWPKWPGT